MRSIALREGPSGRSKNAPFRRLIQKGEWTSPTQPFPTKPPAFDHQGVTPDNFIDFTPALKQTALQLLEGYKIGPLYTPPPEDGSAMVERHVQVPGYGGGANWQSGAADPETRVRLCGLEYESHRHRKHAEPQLRAADGDTAEYNQSTAAIPRSNGLRSAQAAIRENHGV